jgi:hypothetical protein
MGAGKEIVIARPFDSKLSLQLTEQSSGYRALFPRVVKRPTRETDHSIPSSIKVKNRAAIHPLPPHVFMAWCLIKRRIRGTYLSTGSTLPYLYLIDFDSNC